jgi:hypothetical protein
MPWQVEFDESFKRHIGALSQQFQDEIAIVLLALREGATRAYFDPSEFDPGDEYSTQTNEEHKYVVCQHVRGWCGWKLSWEKDYVFESTVNKVVI